MNLKELKAIASAATPGPWAAYNGYAFPGALIEGISKQGKVDVVVDDGTYDNRYQGVQRKEDAAHISAFNPQTVLSLLSDLEKCVEALTSIGSVHKPKHASEEYWTKVGIEQCATVLATDTKISRSVLSSLTIRSDEG